MNGRIRGILFDKDGTLIDYAASWVPINVEAARFAARGDSRLSARLLEIGGQNPTTGHVAAGSLFAASNASEIAAAWAEAGSLYDAGQLTRELDRIFTDGASGAVAVPGIADLFESLARCGIRTGIATSDCEASARVTLQTIGVRADFVAGYDSGHGAKPGAGMALAFAAFAGIEPRTCAMVGDNLHDIRMGRAAGYGFCFGVLTGTGSRSDLEGEADHVFADATEIYAWLASIDQAVGSALE